MNATLIIREARPAELAVAARHYLDMRHELGWSDGDLRPDWEAAFARVYSDAADSGDARYFVAEENGSIIGSAAALRKRSFSENYEHREPQGYLANVFVDQEHRGRGAARALTTAALDWLRSIGCASVRLQASRWGRPLYESMGFRPSDEMELTL